MSRPLTPRTNMDTLRKDAKRWLKALHAGDLKAEGRLLAAWPNAPAELALRHAQHALAREYGCESWIALKAAIEDHARTGKNHAERVDQLLRHGWDGEISVAQRIFRLYPDIARDSLFTAAACGDLAEVERRLGRNPDEVARTGGSLNATALAYVTYSRLDSRNAVAIARRLLEAGADPNFRFVDGGGSPFTVLGGTLGRGEGSRPEHPQARELVDMLIEAGVEPFDLRALYNISSVGTDTHWYDVLWRHCVARGITDKWASAAAGRPGGGLEVCTLDFLLESAVGQNHLARVDWLLAHGADPEAPQAFSGQSVHTLARLSGFHEIAALLERHGARPAHLGGVQALQVACLRLDEAGARALLAADPGLVNDPTPLLSAAEFGNAAAIALLLSLGASPGSLGEDGISPLHRAAQSGSLESVNLLIAAGSDVDLHEQRWNGTPLSWAVVLGKPHIAERLAPLSRDVRTLAYMGRVESLEAVLRVEPERSNQALPDDEVPTPLFVLPDDLDVATAVARILLAHGADATRRNGKGRTAIDAARARDLDEAADLMEAAARPLRVVARKSQR
jgi:ankyrin repeat protein